MRPYPRFVCTAGDLNFLCLESPLFPLPASVCITLLELSSEVRRVCVQKQRCVAVKPPTQAHVVDAQLFPRPWDVLYNSYFVLLVFCLISLSRSFFLSECFSWVQPGINPQGWFTIVVELLRCFCLGKQRLFALTVRGATNTSYNRK